MTLKITFCGFCDFLDELTFDYVVVDKSFNNLSDEQKKRYFDKIVWNDSGLLFIPYESDNMKQKKRWLRIASNLLKAVEIAESSQLQVIAIFDSDIIIPKLDEINPRGLFLTPCYWLYYDWAGEVRPFCSGTNYIFPREKLPTLKYYLMSYSPDKGPVDIYLHDNLPHINVLVNGTTHYVKVNGQRQRMTMTLDNLNAIREHIPEVVMVIP
ncbi:hypothetical protein D878_gp28 [Sulfolobales Mexican rudivirus 1]|uniref:Uncharacterized protein n=1 Tax=Sulfolobales Mexican rod-shaped virus 1 TaxID=2848122 RepID=K4NZH4_9VIRU|nr:hypothetical protein D878_gp28 [Sulfolobales Mexican rudivirus 1]AFV51255.1 hypothetical protein [Sulfolobales Mexican rod-shaped virus 1]